MTVDELIALLQALPPQQRALPVQADGCDCVNPVTRVQVERANVTLAIDDE